MDLIRLSEHFHKLRDSDDWKSFESALKTLLQSPACAKFEAAIAPATGKLEVADFFHLLSGFVRQDEPLDPDTERMTVRLSYQEIYEYDDRPSMTLSEDYPDATIWIGLQSFPQMVQLFKFQRGTLILRFGRAKLDGISYLGQLNDPARPATHRMIVDDTKIEIPIQFFNVVTETDKYTGEQTTFADFYVPS